MTSQRADMTILHDRIEKAEVSARSALGASAPWKEALVKGIALAYDDTCDDTGRGDEIVCLHAIGHGARDFERLRHRFGQGYRVVALDWPDHGNSGPDATAASAERYLELLIDFMDAAGLRRPVIVGNSIGGAVAIRYAAERPDRVRGLILENPGGLYRIDRLSRIAIAAMVRFFSAGARRAWWFPAAYRAYYRTVLPMREAAEQRSRVTAAGLEMAPILAQAWRSFGEPAADLRPLVARINCPVLFAWAKRDRIIQLKRCLPAIRRFPDARLETFDAGHAAHLEAPDAFERSVERFLEGLQQRA